MITQSSTYSTYRVIFTGDHYCAVWLPNGNMIRVGDHPSMFALDFALDIKRSINLINGQNCRYSSVSKTPKGVRFFYSKSEFDRIIFHTMRYTKP